MKVKLIRLGNYLANDVEKKEAADNFISDINSSLLNEDIELDENADSKELGVVAVFVESGGAEQKFIKLFDQLEDYILLLTHQKNNSLPAAFEIKTYILDHGKRTNVVLGANEEEIASLISMLLSTNIAKKAMDNANLGVIGHPSDWLIASQVDYSEVKERFNFNLIDIPYEELKNEIALHQIDTIPHFHQLENKWKGKHEDLIGAFEIYSAIKRLISKYDLQGLTIRCFDLLSDFSNTACLALALLNEEGIVSTCEGDIPTLITMFIVHHLNQSSSFQANVSKIDLEQKSILVAHCTVPMNMLSKYELDTHFESGLGVAVKGELSLSECSLIKISPKLDSFYAAYGEIKSNPNLSECCRTQIVIKLEDEDLYELIKTNKANHVVIAYGNIIYQFYDLFQAYMYEYEQNHKKD